MNTKLVQLETLINDLISRNIIGDNSVDSALILGAILVGGIDYARQFKGSKKFISNLIQNGAMSKEGVLYISEEDEEYNTIWYCLTILVGEGIIERHNVK